MMDFIQRHREEILELAKYHGASNIRVFGSFARGDATERSDIDFLAAFEARRSYLDLIGFQQALEDLLGRRVDVLTDAELKPAMQRRVLEDVRSL